MKEDTFTAFIDFTKAYDSTDRGILFTKVLNFGISGLMYKALLALYDFLVSCLICIFTT